MLRALRLSFFSLAFCVTLIAFGLFPGSSVYSVPNLSQSSLDTDVRAVVEQYFARYATKDLDGLLSLWSAKSPDYAAVKKDLERQFAAEDYRLSAPSISRIKVEGEQASLRATVKLTTTDLKTNKQRERQIRSNFALVREDGRWKVWRFVPAENDLAEMLVKAKTEEERSGLLAQEKELVTPDLVQALNNQGDRLRSQGNFTQALAVHILSQSIGEPIGDQAGVASALEGIGNTHEKQGNYAKALEHLQKSLAISEALRDEAGIAASLNNLANVHQRQGNLAQALDYLQRSLRTFEALGDKGRIARALGNLATVQWAQSDYAAALESNQKALAIFETLGDKARVALVSGNIGIVYHSLGNYRLALDYNHRQLAVSEALGNKLGMAISLNNIGRVYRVQGNYAQALEYYQKSLAISEAIGSKAGIALVVNNLGNVHRVQGNYARALESYQKSLAIREEIGDKGGVASTLNNIGRTHHSQGNYAQALVYFQKSLALRGEIGDRSGIADTLNGIGDVYEKQGQYSEALQTATRAADLARQIGDTELLWKARYLAGTAARSLKDTAQARLAFEEAISIIETLRANLAGGERDQQRYFESKVSSYYAMVDLLNAEGKPAEALTFAERAKARVLVDVLQTGRVNATKAMTEDERERERQLNNRLVSLNSQISAESNRRQPDQARLTELKALLDKARLEFGAFQTALYAAHPELRVQRGEARPLTLEQTAGLLRDAASALLEYVVTDEVTYLFVVTKRVGKAEVKVFRLPVKRAELAEQTADFRQQLARRDLAFRASAHQLHDLLIKPAHDLLLGKTNLVIVPDDQLWELPFQALLSEDSRYLIERSALVYAPSLTVLREMKAQRSRRSAEATSALLALGNPTISSETIERATLTLRDEKLVPLPEAEEEVKRLGQLYGPARSKVYIGPEAREDRVKTEGGRAGILHFATHGILNNASPMYSHLVLAQSGNEEDGLLEAWELMQLDLKADLAVLSACETARGRYGAGEGVIGLTWALFVAGVPSTVVSQWKVEAASTRDLMLNFHRQLRASRPAGKVSKGEALRQAALQVLRKPEMNHPFYWAGFVLIGDDR